MQVKSNKRNSIHIKATAVHLYVVLRYEIDEKTHLYV